MVSLWSTTGSVLFFWVRRHLHTEGRRDIIDPDVDSFVVLSEELQSIVGQLVKQRTSQKIDMDDHSR